MENLSEEQATALELRRMLKKCPICKSKFAAHSYAIFASSVINEEKKNDLIRFISALREKRWKEALSFQDWDALADHMIAYALLCTNGEIGLVVVRSPFEIFEGSSVMICEALNEENSHQLESVIDPKLWHLMEG